MIAADRTYALHQGARRILQLDDVELGIVGAVIGAGGFQDGLLQSCAGFTHFMLELQATTLVAPTTLDIRIVPRIRGTLTGLSPGSMVNEEFPAAVITTVVGTLRYSAYWGEARGLIAGALGTGSTFCFAPVFLIRVRNTGANGVTGVTTNQLVCM